MNRERIRRLYSEMGLQLRNKTPKRRVKAKLWNDRVAASHPNAVRAMDFMHDPMASGRKLRILAIVDTFSHYSPASDPRFNSKGEDVVQTLERVCREVAHLQTIRVGSDSEFISRDMDVGHYWR